MGVYIKLRAVFNEVSNPFRFQIELDRWIGFIHWDIRTRATWVKIFLLAFSCTYSSLSLASMAWIDPSNLSMDHYLGMWFLIAAGGPCYCQWSALVLQRITLAKVIDFLVDIQRLDDPRRARLQPWIFLYSMLHCYINLFLQAGFWAFAWMYTSALAYVAPNGFLRIIAFMMYPCNTILIGTLANTCQVTVFTVMLVFAMEFQILGQDLQRACSSWDSQQIRSCIGRHQQLLEKVLEFRHILKTYLFLSLQVYFLLITCSCVLLTIQLKQRDSLLLYTVFNLTITLLGFLLYGLLCDFLDRRVTSVGIYLYNSAWVDKFRLKEGRTAEYRTMRQNILLILQRSQKRVNFSCGGLATMSIETCMTVIQMGYTAFTVLMNTGDNT